MTDKNIFAQLLNNMVTNYKEMYIRMNHLADDKDNYKIYLRMESKLSELKQHMTKINNIIENINMSIDDTFAEYGEINNLHSELIANCFTESNSDICSDNIDDSNDLSNSLMSTNTEHIAEPLVAIY